MGSEAVKAAIFRTLAFHEAWNYAPTLPELIETLDFGLALVTFDQSDVSEQLERQQAQGEVQAGQGRFALAGSLEPLRQEIRSRDFFQPRKRRRAWKVAKWLVRLGGVRFVALANTTALGNARDSADLDFFIIVKAGNIWAVRFISSGVLKLLGLRPRPGHEKDSVCLSYFIADDALDISSHALPGNDPYFRFWFLSLLPLYDDGVSQDFWDMNSGLRARHPLSKKWKVPPDFTVKIPHLRLSLPWFMEKAARTFQQKWFPRAIKDKMNKDTTVMVTDSVLKFHVSDNREEYRRKYQEICRQRGIA